MNDDFPGRTMPRSDAAEVSTQNLEIPFGNCLIDSAIDPCMIVIMGATGDLTARKLIPALFNLHRNNVLPDRFLVVGCGRTSLSDEDFRQRLKNALSPVESTTASQWQHFARRIHYRIVEYGDPESYVRLAQSLELMNSENGTGGNRVFYIALPPSLYHQVAQLIGRAGLSEEKSRNRGWSRIVVEKPFGRDLDSAAGLNRAIQDFFKEHQIFRIDHYLAKETVQNILMFRFANAIFEPVWNRRYIEHVRITATETLGVEHRAGYYEEAGILRDMFQNHMMQLLALTAMEPPSIFISERVRDERVKVFGSLRPFPVDHLKRHIVMGQYGRGSVNGEAVCGYREEPGVRMDSLTPTFAMMKVFIDNWRWQGIPFFLTSGKRMSEKRTEIAIQFKEVPHSMFRQVLGESITANRLHLGIYPDEKISLTFQTKNPGARVCLRSVVMDFRYDQNYTGPIMDAYEKVLIDCISGDQMLFWRQDGVEQCWAFLTPVLKGCETCEDRTEMLHIYPAGSRGPEAVREIDGRL
jgi:glucose-6-phosphate 1-dehydrogenase